jgi:CheY-like chemotaxis protein
MRPEQPLRVLLIEDNVETADSLRLLLEFVGHEVAVAHTGPAGVEAATQWAPDAVVCDIGLPGLDGWGVARALRGQPATRAARLIAISGYDSQADRERSLQAGFDHHLAKPADPEELFRLLAPQGKLDCAGEDAPAGRGQRGDTGGDGRPPPTGGV